MNIGGKSVEIKCRRCGKTAKAEDFVLDYVYKMAVCPSCIKERKAADSKTLKQSFKESEPAKEEAPKVQHPPGWDEEDEYLEKLARQKQKGMAAQQDSTPKPYQMGGTKPSPYSSPQQSSQPSRPMSAADFGMRSTPKPSVETHAAKPMGVADFGMRSSLKPAEQPHPAPSSQSSKPMDMASFGMRSSAKAETAPSQPERSAIATERAEKSNADPDKTKYKCKKCGYEFFYNRERNMPRGCPYCNTQVMHLI